jgi:acetylornithine/N-succinyldiaminopimelate aminotransferase
MTTAPPPDRSVLMSTYAEPAVTFVRGRGTELWDSEGQRYLDFLSGLAVTSLGHAHPAVASAVARQAAELIHVSNLFGNELGPTLAKQLDELIGDGTAAGGKVFFANSGAEANECALKLARRANPGRPAVVAAEQSFHGRTLLTLAATGQPAKHEGFAPLPGPFRHVAYGDLVALEALASDTEVGAVILEAIQGEAGVIPPPPGYLQGVRDICDANKLLLIVDEVQTGLGRTGRWFGFHHSDIRPDIVTVAKALGNGVPVGACWAKAEVAAAFQPGDHGSTFGGQPLAAAAALATLSALKEMDAPARATEAGAALSAAIAKVPGVVGVRGAGLLLGVLLADGLDAKTVAAAALARGLVVNAPVPGVIRLAPPLNVSATEIDEAVAIFESAVVGATPAAKGGPAS